MSMSMNEEKTKTPTQTDDPCGKCIRITDSVLAVEDSAVDGNVNLGGMTFTSKSGTLKRSTPNHI